MKLLDDFKYIKEFGRYFEDMNDQMERSLKNNNTMRKTIIFFGLTGSGKSTLVQLLSGDNKKLISKEISSGEYIITGEKIGSDTITSKTLFPDLVIDNETGLVLCDNPGFEDTRSSIHELITASSIISILKQSSKIKIVLVVPHSSLMVGMYKNDFIKFLSHTIDVIDKVDKYKKSIYLVASKTENTYKKIKGEMQKITNEQTIKAIYNYLNTTQASLETKIAHNNNTIFLTKRLIESTKLIKALMEDHDSSNSKIGIFRKPEKEGPLIDIQNFQEERMSLRKMLLSEKDFVDTTNTEFGFSLSDHAKIDLIQLFSQVERYIYELSQLVSHQLQAHYEKKLHVLNLKDRLKRLQQIKTDITQLEDEIGKSSNPQNFITSIEDFIKNKEIDNYYAIHLKNITKIISYLQLLEKFTNTTKYDTKHWQIPFNNLNNYISNDIESYKAVDDVLNFLTSYYIQKNKTPYINLIKKWGNIIHKDNFNNFLAELMSGNKYINVIPNTDSIEMLNVAINITLLSHLHVSCDRGTLFVFGYFVLLSEIPHLQFYDSYQNLVIMAKHTIFINRNLDDDILRGHQIVIISPIWKIIGERLISVDGRPGKTKGITKKAYTSLIGKNGQNGGNGGIFQGIGMIFENSNFLKITANGGAGEDGQDGGDGEDGRHGIYGYTRGTYKERWGSNPKYTLYSQERGQQGGNSGAGGKGGHGGEKGIVKVTSVGSELHEISIYTNRGTNGKDGKNGTPGKGGYRACDLLVKEKQHYYLFFFKNGVTKTEEFVHCTSNADGSVIYNDNNFNPPSLQETPQIIGLCEYVNNCSVRICKQFMQHLSYYDRQYSNFFDKKFNEFVKNAIAAECLQ